MKNAKEQDKKEKDESRELLEEASSRLAEIIISWIEFGQQNKDKNVYEKRG